MALKISSLKPNPRNPRTISPEKIEQLKKTLLEFGDLSGFVYNRKSRQVVGGHQRQAALPKDSEVVIERTYKKPTRTGTLAEGYVLFEGERFQYREVDWPKKKEMAANLAANKGAGEWNYQTLGEWMQELGTDGFDLDLTLFDENERKGFFSDLWEDDSDKVEKVEAHVEGFRDTIKVKCPKANRKDVVILLRTAIEESKFCDVVEIES